METAIDLINLKKLKSPKGYFILGNLLQFKKKDKNQILEKWTKECGELYTIKLLNKYILVSNDSEITTTILKEIPNKFKRYSKIDAAFKNIGIDAVFNTEGAYWEKQRTVVTEALTARKIRGYYPIIHEKTTHLIDKIETYANTETPIEILKDFIAYTIDVTTQVAFGYKLKDHENEKNTFQKHLTHIFPVLDERITTPLTSWKFSPTSKDKKLIDSLKAIERIIAKVAKSVKENLIQSPELKETPVTFLQGLLVEQEKTTTTFDEKGASGNILAMLLAGEDTISNTLTCALFYLAQNPEMVLRIRKEAHKVYQKNSVPKRYEQLANLKYTKAVIQEAIRLKPTGSMVYFEANEEVTLKNIAIPKETKIIAKNSFDSMQVTNFSDPTNFDPTRWLKDECVHKNHSPEANNPFKDEAKIFPGMHLSIIEMTTVISSICKQFDMSLVEKPEIVKESFSFVASPQNLKIIFKKSK